MCTYVLSIVLLYRTMVSYRFIVLKYRRYTTILSNTLKYDNPKILVMGHMHGKESA